MRVSKEIKIGEVGKLIYVRNKPGYEDDPISSGIRQLLLNANGRSTQHTYNSVDQILDILVKAEEHLFNILPKKYWVGVRIISTSGGSVCKAYKYSRNVTSLIIVRRLSGWFLSGVSCETISAFEKGGDKYHIPSKFREIAAENALRRFIFDK